MKKKTNKLWLDLIKDKNLNLNKQNFMPCPSREKECLLQESQKINKLGLFRLDEGDLYYQNNQGIHIQVTELRISGFKCPLVWINGQIVPTACLKQLQILLSESYEPKYNQLFYNLQEYQPDIEKYVNKIL